MHFGLIHSYFECFEWAKHIFEGKDISEQFQNELA